MKKYLPITFVLLTVSGISGCVADDDGERGSWLGSRSLDVAPVEYQLYRDECGSCHFAYQPGLLNAASWERVMAGLDDHFGDNAELSPVTAETIRRYLLDNAADRSDYKRAQKIAASQARGEPVLRITETPYFIRKHDELPRAMVMDNPEIGSFSRCAACHTGAETGSYDEHAIRIPGFGKWDD